MEAFKSIRHKLAAQALNDHLIEAAHSLSVASAIAIKAFGEDAPSVLKYASKQLRIKSSTVLSKNDEEISSYLNVLDLIDPVLSTCFVHTEPLQFWPNGIQKVPCNPTQISLVGQAASLSATIRLKIHNLENIDSLEIIPDLKNTILAREQAEIDLLVKDDDIENEEIIKIWESLIFD